MDANLIKANEELIKSNSELVESNTNLISKNEELENANSILTSDNNVLQKLNNELKTSNDKLIKDNELLQSMLSPENNQLLNQLDFSYLLEYDSAYTWTDKDNTSSTNNSGQGSIQSLLFSRLSKYITKPLPPAAIFSQVKNAIIKEINKDKFNFVPYKKDNSLRFDQFMYYSKFDSLVSIDLSNLKYPVLSFYNAFSNSELYKLESIDLSNNSGSNIDMSYMFNRCYMDYVTKLNLKNINGASINATNMFAFSNFNNLTEFDFSSFNIVTNAENMFYYCNMKLLKNIDCSNFGNNTSLYGFLSNANIGSKDNPCDITVAINKCINFNEFTYKYSPRGYLNKLRLIYQDGVDIVSSPISEIICNFYMSSECLQDCIDNLPNLHGNRESGTITFNKNIIDGDIENIDFTKATDNGWTVTIASY